MTNDLKTRVARVIAERALGFKIEDLMASKREWVELRGVKNGYDRDVNDPFQSDIYDAAEAVLAMPEFRALPEGWVAAPSEATEEMVWAAPGRSDQASEKSMYHGIYRAMIAARPAHGSEG